MEREEFNEKILQLGSFEPRLRLPGRPTENKEMVYKVHTKEQPCPDCERMVKDRVIQIKIVNPGQPNQRWQRKCLECKDYLGRSVNLI